LKSFYRKRARLKNNIMLESTNEFFTKKTSKTTKKIQHTHWVAYKIWFENYKDKHMQALKNNYDT
jgi:hypothetical protein